MEILWCLLLLLFSARLTSSTPGLSCLNDYITNISCVWNSTEVAPNVPCRINTSRNEGSLGLSNKSCDLKPLSSVGSSVRGCSVVVGIMQFFSMEKMSVRVDCGGSQVDELKNYKPFRNIKLHPPGVPIINTSTNGTVVSWSRGKPFSSLITRYTFQVQIKREQQPWKDGKTFTKTHLEPSISVEMDRGVVYQVRVRVRSDRGVSVWSDWSPVSSWREEGGGPTDAERLTVKELQTLAWSTGAVVTVALISVILLVLHATCSHKRKKRQHVPDPAKYFHTLNTTHGGNLQKWLVPLFREESFLKAPPREDISPVDVSEAVVPSVPGFDSTSITVSSALLQSNPAHDWAAGDNSGQPSSSVFSGIDYFLTNLPIDLEDSDPVHFTYQEDHLHALPWSALSSGRYERLLRPGTISISHQREPLSPDSGFSAGSRDPSEEEEDSEEDVAQVKNCPSLVPVPVSLPALSIPPTGAPRPPNLPLVPPPAPELDSALPSGDSYSAWPVEGALGRSSSMTMQAKVGYLTIKELQTTYSNKSI